jgi:RNA polymerase sigma-70 factor (ECF subfamily)
MNSPADITYPGLPASVISDPAGTQEKVRTRGSSNPSGVTRQRTSGRSPSPKGRVEPTRTDAIQQNMLQELFLTSRKRFIQIAYRILGNRDDAEDAVQDAFLSACRHLREFEGRSALTTWFTRIVMNAALMMRRKRKNAAAWPSNETDAAMSAFAETVPDIQPNPEEACSQAESFEILETRLKKLNPRLREAVYLTYYDELSGTEASVALGISLTTYKARLFRGRRLLQQSATPTTRANSHQTKESAIASRPEWDNRSSPRSRRICEEANISSNDPLC